MSQKRILVTGAAGFIGMHLVINLIELGHVVIGCDNLNDYYNINLKKDRLANCGISSNNFFENEARISSVYLNYKFYKIDIKDRDRLEFIFLNDKIEYVIHLAAQAGVRFSINNPQTYVENNLVGFFNIIDLSRIYNIKHFVYASSSSVYGNSVDVPFNEEMCVDKPESLYAATKKCNELIAHSYSKIYGLKTSGLRFFTVYGPWGRPDMAYYSFTKNIIEENIIKVFNNGNHQRDFTYIDDIISGMITVFTEENRFNLYEIYNIGNETPVSLINFINIIEDATQKKAKIIFEEMQSGDVIATFADVEKIKKTGYKPLTNLKKGIKAFVNWYFEYHKIKN
jgi:UDP-glucuronate 4-epimerase